jgi:hypothetical protein
MVSKEVLLSRKPIPRTSRFWPALAPIYWLAAINAAACWGLAWLFWDRFVFSATLFGLGCFPIVVAVSAYLYLLVKRGR